MNKRMKKTDNFLMLVPQKSMRYQWKTDSQGLVEIIIPRETLLDKMVRMFIDTPKVMRIHLDALGSCVWRAIDGRRNIHEIGMILEREFGEKVMPLYERLITYITILKNNKFIILDKHPPS